MTGQQRQDFCDEFLRARNDGMTRIEAYRHARNAMSLLGKPYPAYNTLIHWLRYGLPKDGVQDTGPSPAAAEQEPEATEIAACGNEEEFTQPGNTDRTDLYLALLRLYRYRREEDIDAVVDLTVPELSGEVEA